MSRCYSEERQRAARGRENALNAHWVKYLKEIQAQNAYPNWCGPPYDLYTRNQK